MKVKLPDKYISQMKEMLGDEYDAYVSVLEQPMYHALRVNTLKLSVEDFKRISPYKLTPVPWCDNGFYYDASEGVVPSKHPFYHAGLYYLQEPSAMLPAATLPIEPGDRVLDMCAAPGGKSTELAARLRGTGLLMSNDVSASRIKALIKNLELFGVSNAVVTCMEPKALADRFPGYFNKIMIDAPCSGEGMFRKSSAMISAWEQNGNELFAGIQRDILREAVRLLSPGGMILYSTCTFCKMEDEESVRYLLSLDDSLSLEYVSDCEGFVRGYGGLTETVHLFPHRVKGEGHFTALIRKAGEYSNTVVDRGLDMTAVMRFPEITEFMEHITDKSCICGVLQLLKDKLYLMPYGMPDMRGIRTMRQGVYMGELKKKRFEPSQAMAMLLRGDAFDNVLDLGVDDAVRYLKGETLDTDAMDIAMQNHGRGLDSGYVLVTISGYPIGFGKLAGGTLKNKYLPGWRLS